MRACNVRYKDRKNAECRKQQVKTIADGRGGAGGRTSEVGCASDFVARARDSAITLTYLYTSRTSSGLTSCNIVSASFSRHGVTRRVSRAIHVGSVAQNIVQSAGRLLYCSD